MDSPILSTAEKIAGSTYVGSDFFVLSPMRRDSERSSHPSSP